MLHAVVGSTRSLTFWAPIRSGLYASLLTECAGLQMSMGNNLLSGTISTGGCISPLCVSPPLHLPNQEPSFIDNPDPGKCLMLPCHSESSNALVLNHTSPAFLLRVHFQIGYGCCRLLGPRHMSPLWKGIADLVGGLLRVEANVSRHNLGMVTISAVTGSG